MARQSPSRSRWRLHAQRDVDRALEHPHLLVHEPVARAGLERHAPAGRELHLDDLHRLRHARRARRCAAGSPRPGPATAAGRSRRATGPLGAGAAPGVSNSEASITPRPAASFSSTTAVGLLSPRSMSEIIERLTPLLAGQGVEREALGSAQVAHPLGDALVQVGRCLPHGGHTIHHAGCAVKPGSRIQRSMVTTCACILPSTAPRPNRRPIASAATSVASSSREASRASISLRSGVPWQ